jgi:hypothetical protein
MTLNTQNLHSDCRKQRLNALIFSVCRRHPDLQRLFLELGYSFLKFETYSTIDIRLKISVTGFAFTVCALSFPRCNIIYYLLFVVFILLFVNSGFVIYIYVCVFSLLWSSRYVMCVYVLFQLFFRLTVSLYDLLTRIKRSEYLNFNVIVHTQSNAS